LEGVSEEAHVIKKSLSLVLLLLLEAGLEAGGGAVGVCTALAVVASGGSLEWGKFSWLAGTLAVGIQVTKLHIKDARREAVTMPTNAFRGVGVLLLAASRETLIGGGASCGETGSC
jgi:hypothetical protein